VPAHLLLQQFFIAQRPLQLGVLGHVAPICSQTGGGSNSRTLTFPAHACAPENTSLPALRSTLWRMPQTRATYLTAIQGDVHCYATAVTSSCCIFQS
jgi:hypothetical protein